MNASSSCAAMLLSESSSSQVSRRAARKSTCQITQVLIKARVFWDQCYANSLARIRKSRDGQM